MTKNNDGYKRSYLAVLIPPNVHQWLRDKAIKETGLCLNVSDIVRGILVAEYKKEQSLTVGLPENSEAKDGMK